MTFDSVAEREKERQFTEIESKGLGRQVAFWRKAIETS